MNCSQCGGNDITININPPVSGFSSSPIYSCNSCGCSNCTQPTSSTCNECDSECSDMTNTSCAVYNGAPLDNIDIETNENLNVVLSHIDEKIGDVLGISGSILTKKVTIPSSDILALHSTPIVLLPAPGAGKFINVLTVCATISNGTTPYVASAGLAIYIDTASNNLMGSSDTLIYTDDRIHQFAFTNDNSQFIIDKELMIKSGSPNPTSGDGDLLLYITYQIITV